MTEKTPDFSEVSRIEESVLVAKLDAARAVLAHAGEKGRTLEGAIGTVPYMSPEQLKSVAIDQRSDVFSLGVVLYEMMTGKRPFERSNLMAILRAIGTDTPKSPRELDETIPQDVSDLLMRLLEKDPEKRYPSAADLIDAIAACERTTEPTALAAGHIYWRDFGLWARR